VIAICGATGVPEIIENISCVRARLDRARQRVRAAALAMAERRAVASVSGDAVPGKAVVPIAVPAGTASAGAVIAAGATSAAITARLHVALVVAASAALAAIVIFLIWRWRHRAEQEAAVKGTSNGLG
jgi:hypothetical protein